MSAATRRRARRRTKSHRRLALRCAEVGLGIGLLDRPLSTEERRVIRAALWPYAYYPHYLPEPSRSYCECPWWVRRRWAWDRGYHAGAPCARHVRRWPIATPPPMVEVTRPAPNARRPALVTRDRSRQVRLYRGRPRG